MRDKGINPKTCDPVDLLVEHGEDFPPESQWPRMLRNLVAVLFEYNRRVLKLTEKQASEDARERVFLIANYLGGRFVYLPRGEQLRTAVRNALILRLSDTMRAADICELFGVGEHMVYRVIARGRATEGESLRGKLFDAR